MPPKRPCPLVLVSLLVLVGACGESAASRPDPVNREPSGRWTTDAAWDWYERQPWWVGANFAPSTAINQLEMWQVETFDPATIDRELGWAADVGFNVMRVFLHDLLWEADPDGFAARIDRYLEIADRHGIGTLFVLFDHVWGPYPQLGPQPEPVPGVHNSGWVQSPAQSVTIGFPDDPAARERLERYVREVIRRYRDDPRVVGWDLVNEPGNTATGDRALPLLEAAFAWARDERPAQPLTSSSWFVPHSTGAVSHAVLELSDVVTFHDYFSITATRLWVRELRGLTDRPIVCTEYMARTAGSTFATHLPFFREQGIGAIHWGLVAGKTQTIWPWGSPPNPGIDEPPLWFHDVLRPDGTPYDPAEIEVIQAELAAAS